MTVAELKAKLQGVLQKLDKLDDRSKVEIKNNTYFLRDCYMFLGLSAEGYVRLDKIELEQETTIKLRDIDLCIALPGEENEEGLTTLDELVEIGKKHHVSVELESERSESSWPSFSFEGDIDDVALMLEELGFDESSIDEMLEEGE